MVKATAVPCVECGGCGFSHCCDGLQACGEVEGDTRLLRRQPMPETTPQEAQNPSVD
jgi:hypothetical protein